METREKLIRLLPVFLFSLTLLGFVSALISSYTGATLIYLTVPFLAACGSRYYCVKKYPYNSKWERIFRITILVSAILAISTVFGYLAWTSLM